MQSMESERKPIRLIGLDLDGTLLTSAKELTKRTRAVLEELLERGIEIVPVTGRPLSGLPPEVRSLPGLRYAITSNGAVTYDLRDNRVLRSFYIRPETALPLLKTALERKLVYGIFDGGYGYSDRETYERMVSFFQGRAALPYVLASRRPSDDILAFCEHPPIGIENIWIVTKDREARDALADHIRNTTKLHVMRTAERDVEAVHGSADKGMALEHLGMHLGISSEAIMAFGDNDNDKGMLKRAGIGVAMGNAPERIKGAADFVTGDNESEGVARFLEKYFNERDGVLWL